MPHQKENPTEEELALAERSLALSLFRFPPSFPPSLLPLVRRSLALTPMAANLVEVMRMLLQDPSLSLDEATKRAVEDSCRQFEVHTHATCQLLPVAQLTCTRSC